MILSSPHRRLICATVLALAAVAALPAVAPGRAHHRARSSDTSCDRAFPSGNGATNRYCAALGAICATDGTL